MRPSTKHPLLCSLSRALKRERGTHREAMGGEGRSSTVLARPSPSRGFATGPFLSRFKARERKS